MKESRPVIALLSDFGTRDHYVGAMRGVLARLAPMATLIDISHDVPRFDVGEGAETLLLAAREFPAGTIFVGVVDPGVGGARRGVAARARDGSWFVGPDNGLLWPALQERGLDHAMILDRVAAQHEIEVSATFHGRDLFAPAAAHIARGETTEILGKTTLELERLETAASRREGGALVSTARRIDEFGNVITGITQDEVASLGAIAGGGRLQVEIGEDELLLPFLRCYAEAPPGAPLALIDSSGRLELAIDRGSFAESHAISRGALIRVSWRR